MAAACLFPSAGVKVFYTANGKRARTHSFLPFSYHDPPMSRATRWHAVSGRFAPHLLLLFLAQLADLKKDANAAALPWPIPGLLAFCAVARATAEHACDHPVILVSEHGQAVCPAKCTGTDIPGPECWPVSMCRCVLTSCCVFQSNKCLLAKVSTSVRSS